MLSVIFARNFKRTFKRHWKMVLDEGTLTYQVFGFWGEPLTQNQVELTWVKTRTTRHASSVKLVA